MNIINSDGHAIAHSILYHGTAASQVPEIEREGLIPRHGKGADYWAAHAPENANAREDIGLPPVRPPSVYLTLSLEKARQYAAYSAEENNSIPALLKVKIPNLHLLVADEEDSDNCFRYHGVIPANCIAIVHHKGDNQ